jgi:hypothetical protein
MQGTRTQIGTLYAGAIRGTQGRFTLAAQPIAGLPTARVPAIVKGALGNLVTMRLDAS